MSYPDWEAAAGELQSLVTGVLNTAGVDHRPFVSTKLAGHWAGRIVGAALREQGHKIELSDCCKRGDGTQMTSPSGEVVAGNGECAEFLLPAGRYLLVPLEEE